MGTVATLYEQQRAKRFLSLIGARGPSAQLVLAVVAWMRVEGQDFNAERYARRLRNGATYEAVTFTPIRLRMGLAPEERADIIAYNEAGAARAARINAEREARAYLYKLILTAARKDRASDFLYAIALSEWDSGHYGGYSDSGINVSKNRLFRAYMRFTGLALPTPKQPKAPKPRPLPKVPITLRPPSLQRSYLDPQEARRFYEARHIRPSETVDTGR